MARLRGEGDVSLAVAVTGDGPPVLLIHGFPDSHRLWRNQVGPLAESSRRVIVPDLRGFGASDRPATVEAYRLTNSVADMVAVLDAYGAERADVIGHDWGAGVAWALAIMHPERVASLAVLSVGHPSAFDPLSMEQRRRAWYQLLFQFEGVAEELLLRDDAALLRAWLAGAPDTEAYVEDLSRPGALKAGLSWYRANSHPRRALSRRGFPPATVPTLGVWSSGDAYLAEEPMRASGAHVTGAWRYERLDGPGHWLQLEAPDAVNALLLEHLAAHGLRSGVNEGRLEGP